MMLKAAKYGHYRPTSLDKIYVANFIVELVSIRPITNATDSYGAANRRTPDA
jgi:hypothetical protein